MGQMILLDVLEGGGRRSGQILFIILKLLEFISNFVPAAAQGFFQDSKHTLPDVWARQALEMEKKQIRKLHLAFSFCLYFLNLSPFHTDSKLYPHREMQGTLSEEQFDQTANMRTNLHTTILNLSTKKVTFCIKNKKLSNCE